MVVMTEIDTSVHEEENISLRWDSARVTVCTILDEMIFGQTLKMGCASEALRHHQACCYREFLPLAFCPAIDVLEETGEGGFFERSLEIFISAYSYKPTWIEVVSKMYETR